MFVSKLTITHQILKNIGVAEAAKEAITNAPLIPAWEAKFKKDAIDRTVHHGTHIEGNPLTDEEVKDILDGKDVFAKDRDIQEIINYRNVVKFIGDISDKIGPGRPYLLTMETLLEIHRLTTDRIVPPNYSGQFRARQVVLKDSRTGEISYTPPPAAEVPFLVEDLVNWVN